MPYRVYTQNKRNPEYLGVYEDDELSELDDISKYDTHYFCHSCDVIWINRIRCHEPNCPDAPVTRDCFECGFEFETTKKNGSRICPDCIAEYEN